MTDVNVTVRMMRASDGLEFCPTSFYFSKICNRRSKSRSTIGSLSETLTLNGVLHRD